MWQIPQRPLPPAKLRWLIISRALKQRFGISRGAKNYATSLQFQVEADGIVGRGESVPYARYGEHLEGVAQRCEALGPRVAQEGGWQAALDELPGSCVREALDAARWDWLCKRSGRRIFELVDRPVPERIPSCHTVSLDTPVNMAKRAASLGDFHWLKLKLGGGEEDIARIRAVAAARPEAKLVADANEGWSPRDWPKLSRAAKAAGLWAIEQPLPAGQDQCLAAQARPLWCIADESVHGRQDLAELRGRYDAINIKLGKCGGLDRALALLDAAKANKLGVMVGCMVSSSLSVAPALLLAAQAEIVDLDAPLWLKKDIEDGLRFEGGEILCDFPASLWG